jgi:hypothetical protein
MQRPCALLRGASRAGALGAAASFGHAGTDRAGSASEDVGAGRLARHQSVGRDPGARAALLTTFSVGLAGALVLGFLAHRLKLSPIIGYLLAGVAAGPFTPGFVANRAAAEEFAEIGVILLLFGMDCAFICVS